jgi:hypothetical protein
MIEQSNKELFYQFYKAVGSGLDVEKVSSGMAPEPCEEDKAYMYVPKSEDGEIVDYYVINIYQLIFSTEIGFLDKLCGDKIICVSANGCLAHCPVEGMPKMSCYHVGGQAYTGDHTSIADYHRQQLANMTLDQMVEYIGGL